MTAKIALIAAIGENRVIGVGNSLPWRLPADFAFFKRMTLGKPLIMGRKTAESIGKPLPGRTNIVVSRQHDYQPDGVIVIDSLTAALDHAQTIAQADGVDEVMIGGGAQIYRAAIDLADRLYITHVALAPAGDAYFPAIDPAIWGDGELLNVPPSPNDNAPFTTKLYQRRLPARR